MSDLIIIHRTYQPDNVKVNSLTESGFLFWETCRRQIFLADELSVSNVQELRESGEEIFVGLDAEEFLIEVLCGLKSPLVGETEVFGQFKNWWQNLTDLTFKNKFASRIQHIYSVVKKIREEALCGLGSQSYGSLLRKKITDMTYSSADSEIVIDFVGAGQLVEEMIPWVQKKWAYRIWCRDTEKAAKTEYGARASEILNLNDLKDLSPFVVVAAPLEHSELNNWIVKRQKNTKAALYDFRRDSMTFNSVLTLKSYLHLDDFSTEVQGQKQQIQKNISQAYSKIENWKQEEQVRAQLRPFGWDDL